MLLIDDDPVLLTSLREVLELEGHEVHTANGGRQGIDAFLAALKADQAFPVVITDLGMPHVDGRAVAAAIKAVAPETTVIMLTGWGQRLIEEGDIPDGVHRGAQQAAAPRRTASLPGRMCATHNGKSTFVSARRGGLTSHGSMPCTRPSRTLEGVS